MVGTMNGTERNVAIDRFRGALVVLMVAGDFLSGVQVIPDFLKHASDIGFTIADTVASAFVFVIGLNYGPSFARRSLEGVASANRYFLLRYFSLIGVGAVIAGGANMIGQPTDWGVLQAIGIAGALTLLVIRLSTWMRFAIGILVLIGYQLLLDAAMLPAVLASVHGGLFGAVSWAALLILATAVADIWRRGLFSYVVCCVFLVAAAGISYVVVPVSKHRVSVSFVLITLTLSALVFLVIDVLSRRGSGRAGILCWWGESALALYLIHLLLLGAVVTPPVDWWYVQAPIWLAALQLAGIMTLMTFIARWLHRRRLAAAA
jgi:predicted acyltransferase